MRTHLYTFAAGALCLSAILTGLNYEPKGLTEAQKLEALQYAQDQLYFNDGFEIPIPERKPEFGYTDLDRLAMTRLIEGVQHD